MAKSLIPAQRHDRIQAYLQQQRVASIAELSQWLEVSEATIRRDLESLESSGILERTHGGAILTRRLPSEPIYTDSAGLHPHEKRHIGAAAAALVADGETVLVNSGTTTTEVMRQLALRSDLSRVTLVTTNVRGTLEARAAGFGVILLGGHFRPQSNAIVGEPALQFLRRIYADRCILGVDGFSLKCGLTTPVAAEAEVARTMLERTRGAVTIVADSSKWGVVSNFEIAPLQRAHVLVSDGGLPPDAVADLTAHGLQVQRAADGELEPAGRPGEDPNGRHGPTPEPPHAPLRQAR
jgi:DeoR/GlpR family transcriptional regulator of sugar metabolism